MAKAPGKSKGEQALVEPQQQAPGTEAVAEKPAKSAKVRGDGFDENNKNGNKIFEEWRGEIVIEEKGRGERKKVKRFFRPLVKQHSRRKITQKEADYINISAASSPRLNHVIMFLEPGAEQGTVINVNTIAANAWDETGGEGEE